MKNKQSSVYLDYCKRCDAFATTMVVQHSHTRLVSAESRCPLCLASSEDMELLLTEETGEQRLSFWLEYHQAHTTVKQLNASLSPWRSIPTV